MPNIGQRLVSDLTKRDSVFVKGKNVHQCAVNMAVRAGQVYPGTKTARSSTVRDIKMSLQDALDSGALMVRPTTSDRRKMAGLCRPTAEQLARREEKRRRHLTSRGYTSDMPVKTNKRKSFGRRLAPA